MLLFILENFKNHKRLYEIVAQQLKDSSQGKDMFSEILQDLIEKRILK